MTPNDKDPEEPLCVLYDAATARQMIKAAWRAGYYDGAYTHDSHYADVQGEKCADELLGKK